MNALGEDMSAEPPVAQNLLTQLTPDATLGFRRAGFWGDATIYRLVREHAQRNPDRTAIRDRFGVFSYGTLVDLADRAADELVPLHSDYDSLDVTG